MSDLKIEGLQKVFGEATAVRDLDLHIESGESIVLLGPSGCGKTTTLRMVAGFERPTGGRITIGGTVVAGPGVFVPPDQREVGVVFQSYALWPHMTVADNVGFGLTVRRRRKTLEGGRASIAGRVQSALEQVQLDGLGSRYPHELSGGQQQRVALARALVTEPRVLLLDEPLSNLDTRLREDMRLAIRNIQRESGVTMIYITHDRIEALALADRIVALKAGETQQIGPPEQLYQNPRNRFVALSLGPANFIPATVQSWAPDVVVRLDTGQVVGINTPPGMTRRPSEKVLVCVRPPDIGIERRKDDAETAGGTVREAVFLGDETHYIVDVDGLPDPVRIVQRTLRPMDRGTQVTVLIDSGVGNLIDEPADALAAQPPAEGAQLSSLSVS
ncbi:ABC transporter ATP-binding protein [Modestobacter lapidis]|nr:ABC transporter ATP-binding protein [Modestobacter lapidis]